MKKKYRATLGFFPIFHMGLKFVPTLKKIQNIICECRKYFHICDSIHTRHPDLDGENTESLHSI